MAFSELWLVPEVAFSALSTQQAALLRSCKNAARSPSEAPRDGRRTARPVMPAAKATTPRPKPRRVDEMRQLRADAFMRRVIARPSTPPHEQACSRLWHK